MTDINSVKVKCSVEQKEAANVDKYGKWHVWHTGAVRPKSSWSLWMSPQCKWNKNYIGLQPLDPGILQRLDNWLAWSSENEVADEAMSLRAMCLSPWHGGNLPLVGEGQPMNHCLDTSRSTMFGWADISVHQDWHKIRTEALFWSRRLMNTFTVFHWS